MIREIAMSATLAGALAVAACSPATPAAPPAPVADAPEDIAAVNEVRNAFINAYNSGDAQALANLYTEDAVSEPNNQPTLVGRQAILESLTKMFEQVSVKMNLEPDETRTIGNAGIDRGTYTVEATPTGGGPTVHAEGRYLVVLVKDAEGNWRATRDMDNLAAPPPPVTTAPEGAGEPGATPSPDAPKPDAGS